MRWYISGGILIAVVFLVLQEPAEAASCPPPHSTSQQGQTRVLQGIPAIAQVFAPVAGVKWQEFAQVLAGICAVESICDPTYEHWVQSQSGKCIYSQYQGLFQMNDAERRKAESDLQRMLPQMQQLAQAGTIPANAYQFFQKGIEAGQAMTGDKRFHPEYGVILGAAKHIQINKQLAAAYGGKPIHQAAGHMTAQFSGSVQEKIRRGAFGAPISSAEAWALGQNKVSGATVAGAIESAGAQYSKKIGDMMNRMAQVTNDMSLIPSAVEPFSAPPFQPGGGGYYPNVSRSPISDLLEGGFVASTDTRVQENFPTVSQGASSGSTASPSTGQASGAGTINSDGPGAATLVAQDALVAPGDFVPIAWSSVGMNLNSCSVGIRDSVPFIERVNEGVHRFEVPENVSSATTLVLELKCTAFTGQSIVRNAAITIK